MNDTRWLIVAVILSAWAIAKCIAEGVDRICACISRGRQRDDNL